MSNWFITLRGDRLLQSRVTLGVGALLAFMMSYHYLNKKFSNDPYLKLSVTTSHEVTGEPQGFAIPTDFEQPLSYYEAKIQGRDIFSMGRPVSIPGTFDSGPIPEAVGNSGSLTLKGIIIDDHPQAILQDIATQKTYFAHTGESVQGVVILDIKSDHVTMQSSGQVTELKLK